jgi:Na+/H+ antiporter
VSSAQLLAVLTAAAITLLAVAVAHRRGIPAPIVLVVAGLAIGFVPLVPDVSLTPDVVLLGLLPLLVFDAAITSSPTALRRNGQTIGAIAVLLVIATASAVAAVAHCLGDLSWPVAFVLGTAVGATDAAAATSVMRRLGLPRRLVTLLEGEALFNDATALVLYAAAVGAATTGRFSLLGTAEAIVYSTVAGTAIGLLVGAAGRWARNRLDDPPIEIAASILIAYAAYLPAEMVHASGVLAAVIAGLYLGWHADADAVSVSSRLQSTAFWETLTFLVNSALFLLVGLSFHTFTAAATGPPGRLLVTGTAVVTAVIVVRVAWMIVVGGIAARIRQRNDESPWRERVVLGWAGMRGAITLAALLAVPATTHAGRLLPGRDDIVYLGYGVIIATLVMQGVSLQAVARRLRITEHPASIADTEREARTELAQAALAHLGELGTAGELDADLAEGMQAQYLAQISRLYDESSDVRAGEDAAARATAEMELRQDLNELQRATLSRLRRQGRIGITTRRTVERELDLEQAYLASARSVPRASRD